MKLSSQLILCTITLMSFSLDSCFKNCKETRYFFKMDESFMPELDSIRVGDTLTLISTHSTDFLDIQQNTQVDFSHANLGCNIRILKFLDSSDNNNVAGAVTAFEIVSIIGHPTNNDYIPSQNKGFYFDEKNSQYILKLAFIPKQKGDFSISVGDAMGIFKNRRGCTKASIEINNSNMNNHIYIYQNWRPEYIVSDYERTHMYCFKVY